MFVAQILTHVMNFVLPRCNCACQSFFYVGLVDSIFPMFPVLPETSWSIGTLGTVVVSRDRWRNLDGLER